MRNLTHLFVLCLTMFLLGCESGTKRTAEPKKADASSTAPSTTELRLGSDPWPPFTDLASKPRVAIELVHTALERAGVQAGTRIQGDFGEIVRQIKAGELDGSAAIWRNKEREAYLVYSRPYFENRLVLVGRKGKDVSSTDLSVLRGERIGIVAGYAYGPAVDDAKGPAFVEGSSVQANLAGLAKGGLDYVLADELLVYHLLQQHEEKVAELLQIGKTPIVRLPLHFAIRKDLPGAKGIVERFDRQIRQMMSDGSFNRILQLDWITVDVDGDGKGELVGARTGSKPPSQAYQLFGDAGAVQGTSRYHIDGKTYDGWNQIPDRYQIDRAESPTVTLFEFDF